jgi:hypothetical protein
MVTVEVLSAARAPPNSLLSENRVKELLLNK